MPRKTPNTKDLRWSLKASEMYANKYRQLFLKNSRIKRLEMNMSCPSMILLDFVGEYSVHFSNFERLFGNYHHLTACKIS